MSFIVRKEETLSFVFHPIPSRESFSPQGVSSNSYVLAYPSPLAPSLYLHFSSQGLLLTKNPSLAEGSPLSSQPIPVKDRNFELLSPQEAAQKVRSLGLKNLAIVLKGNEAYLLPRLQGAMDTSPRPLSPRSISEQEHLIEEKDMSIQEVQARLQRERYQKELDLLNQRKNPERDLQLQALENMLHTLQKERQVAFERLCLAYQEKRLSESFSAQQQEESSAQGSKRISLTLETLPPLDQNPLLQRKLQSPHYELTLEESITLLTQCIQYGKSEAEKALEKNTVIFIGNTGAGKSTTVNYLCGCTMELKSYKELGMKGIGKVVIVKSSTEGGLLDEVMPIGHTKESKTFMPQIATHQNLTYCDCPGFLDNRGAEINIANAVNIKHAIAKARSVTVVMLINYYSLKADRARGLTDMLKISGNLFGNPENLIKYKDSLLIGITNSPLDMELIELKEWVSADASSLMQALSERIFIFDPLERPLSGGWFREEFLSQIRSLKPITGQAKIFSTVLTDEDEHKLIRISEQIGQRIEEALHSQNYKHAASHFHRLQELKLIEHITIERLITATHQKILRHLQNEAHIFRNHCHFERFPAAEEVLLQLEDSAAYFNDEELAQFIQRNALRAYYQDSKNKSEEIKRKEREYQRQLREAQKEIQQFLILLEEQRRFTEKQILQQQQDFRQAMQEIEKAMQQTAEGYRSMKQRLEQEMQIRLVQKAAELQTAQGENLHAIQKKIDQERAALQAEYQQKFQDLEKERICVVQEQQAFKDKAQKELAAEKAELEQKLASLEKSKQEKRAEQKRKEAEEGRFKMTQTIPSIAFGKEAWEKYFGSIGEEPPLPSTIHELLQSPCPIWLGKKVHDTHLLTLIPEKVNGKSLTLDYLQDLVKNPQGGGHKTDYRYYDSIKNTLGAKSSALSYWVLMTKDVLPNTRDKSYDRQVQEFKAMTVQASEVKGVGAYQVPKALEAAVSILMEYVRSGKRLYSESEGSSKQYTFTRCEETVYKGERVATGGFDAFGLSVKSFYGSNEIRGFAGLRKCFGG